MRPPEEVKRDLVRQWIARAEQDPGLADFLMARDAPWLNAVVHHAPQAAEKFLKGFTPFSTAARYPSDIPEVTREEARKAAALAAKVRAAVGGERGPAAVAAHLTDRWRGSRPIRR